MAPLGKPNIVLFNGHVIPAPPVPVNAGLSGRAHAAVIEAELTTTLSAAEMNGFRIVQTPDHPTDLMRLYHAIDKVVKLERTAHSYSNFHTWEAFLGVHDAVSARQTVTTRGAPWDRMGIYGNCLAMADACKKSIVKRLQRTASLRRYAYRVELVTDHWNQTIPPANEFGYHVKCILRLNRCCIVIDPISYRGVQIVPLGAVGGQSVLRQWQGHMRWAYVAGPGRARLLVDYEPARPVVTLPRPFTANPGAATVITYSDPYRKVVGGLVGGVLNLTYPTSQPLRVFPHGTFPTNRSTHFYTAYDHLPGPGNFWRQIRGPPNTEYLVATATVYVKFGRRRLKMRNIPCRDWLVRPANAALLYRLRRWNREPHQPAVWATQKEMQAVVKFPGWNQIMAHGFSPRQLQSIRLLEDLSVALGQPAGQITRIADKMLMVWQGII